MREQLIQYVNLLFAGTHNCEDMKQEILQNTLDRFDDLIAEGKVPEAAYRLAIAGIGDIHEILGTESWAVSPSASNVTSTAGAAKDNSAKKFLRAAAIGLYILCVLPLIVLSEMGMDILGLCITVSIVAIATVLMFLTANQEEGKGSKTEDCITPKQHLRSAIRRAIQILGCILYFAVSFLTGAWFITWIIFPIMAAVQGLVNAIWDLMEANDYEN